MALHDFPDRAFRQLLRHPQNLGELMALVLPDLVDAFEAAIAHCQSPLPGEQAEPDEVDALPNGNPRQSDSEAPF